MMRVGWMIICPDSKVRHLSYINEDDAKFDALLMSKRGCSIYPDDSSTGCPEGQHYVEPIMLGNFVQA